MAKLPLKGSFSVKRQNNTDHFGLFKINCGRYSRENLNIKGKQWLF